MDYNRQEFFGACNEKGGSASEPETDVWVCDLGDHEVIYHSYLDDFEEGGVIIDQANGTDWRGRQADLEDRGSEFVLSDAEGNPGPQGGRPMYVEDAQISVDRHDVRAERRQRL